MWKLSTICFMICSALALTWGQAAQPNAKARALTQAPSDMGEKNKAVTRQVFDDLFTKGRYDLIDQIYTQIHKDLAALPLYPFINITAWRTDKIAGPVGQWNQAPFGTYWNMDYWYKV